MNGVHARFSQKTRGAARDTLVEKDLHEGIGTSTLSSASMAAA
jgi:hypothetical protein